MKKVPMEEHMSDYINHMNKNQSSPESMRPPIGRDTENEGEVDVTQGSESEV
jgi:hypothetical protein